MATQELNGQGADAPLERTHWTSWYGVAAMLTVLIYSTIDRQIFLILAEPVKHDMRLSDAQLGLLQGLGLALVSMVTTFPISWLADRYDRRVVAALCIIGWSVAVAGCGLAPNFIWLLVFASIVGVGEAGSGPVGFAMIPDLFPESARQMANSVFAIGARLGMSLAVVLCGVMVTQVAAIKPYLPEILSSLPDWRLDFIAASLFMPIGVLLTLTLPRRVAGNRPVALARPGDEAEETRILPFLFKHARAQLGFYSAMAIATFSFGCAALWVPVSAARYFHQTPIEEGEWLGAMALITGLVGFFGGSLVMRIFEKRFGVRLQMYAMNATVLAAIVCSVLLAFAQSVTQLFVIWGIQATFLMLMTMVVPTILQNMTPRHLRARAFAIAGVFQLVAGAISPLVVGVVSDMVGESIPHGALVSAMIVSVAGLLVAGLLFWWTTPAYVRLVQDIEPHG